ncbi:hypothetical protein DIT71_17355 [Marinobacter vulgaris]|uniref:Peptidoglycan binding-like domain-containing protein n=1 Tax=Marinobacter vulgaris TaxID=1928331 RepID=A0A2V3ZGH9_9GAMM|nr:peptidoglycan-binding domain-containing protein [Marinobacter vulgaris]PXX88375.1 hypothetical protein DIT71_17355 [Marinobacter vulgaris]TSJ66147.1 peptidoglycan-binding protein [Marinobacter vulgaris]
MNHVEKQRILEAERRTVGFKGGSDPKWKRWIIILLCLEVLYIIIEFSFNAALLNVASGVFPDPESLDTIEMAGRILSGVGFGFLVYGIFALKYKDRVCDVKRQTVMLCAIMPFAIMFMYAAQEILIEEVLVENSSDEERFAATYLNMVRPAIRNGTLILEDVPITQETSDRPENKAFLAIAGMLMASNDKVVDRIPREIENIVGAMVHRKALESQDEVYDGYKEVNQRIYDLYINYRDGMSSMPEKINKAMDEMKASAFYHDLDSQLSQAYTSYASGAKSVYEAIGSKTFFYPYYVAGSCNTRLTNYFPSTCRASLEKNGKIYYERTGSKLDVYKFCDIRRINHGACDWSAERVGRIVYSDLTAEKRRTSPIPLTVKGIPLRLNKRQFYQHEGFAENFGKKYHKGITLEAKDLVLRSSGVPNIEASVRKALTRNIKESFVEAANQPFTTDYNDIKYGMNVDQFIRTASVQSAYRSVLGEDSSSIFIQKGLRETEFLEKVLLPMSWNTVADQLDGIPKSINEMVRNKAMTEQGKDAVRAMLVPPIALVLSLFFSLFTLSKVFHHLAALQYIKHPKTFPLKNIKMGITGTFLIVVISFPFLLPENPMVKTGIIEAATGKADDDAKPNRLVTMAMNWMMRAEPAIYPISNAFIGFPLAPFHNYHDANAQDLGTEDAGRVKVLKLISSLSVSQVQRKLNDRGYDAGPVDGLMGGKTMHALKRFQRLNKLPVTGVIDAETSMALMKR